MKKKNYTQPHLELTAVSIESGIAFSAQTNDPTNGFAISYGDEDEINW